MALGSGGGYRLGDGLWQLDQGPRGRSELARREGLGRLFERRPERRHDRWQRRGGGRGRLSGERDERLGRRDRGGLGWSR
jgi:hypothetical protein